MEALRIVVGGFIGLLPAGGVTWDYVQYPLGLRLMGHDVYYIEDTRLYPVYQQNGRAWDDASDGIRHLSKVMQFFGLQDRWAYRDEASGKIYGMTETEIAAVCQTADVFLNISCSTVMRDCYRQIPYRILLDSDPMFTQIQYETEQSFTSGTSGLRQLVSAHNYHFTFGEHIDATDCRIPKSDILWKPTRQPVCLDHWVTHSESIRSTKKVSTLMNWSAGKKLEYQGSSWGQKDVEFPKILKIPTQFPGFTFGVVVNQTGGKSASFPADALVKHHWQILEPEKEAGNWIDYRQFIRSSFAELSVAKETYVKGRTGWFSCRSACYLAAGVPVVCQDTAWSKHLPSGKGLFAFSSEAEAISALEKIAANPEPERKAALEIAQAYFEHTAVLQSMLDQL